MYNTDINRSMTESYNNQLRYKAGEAEPLTKSYIESEVEKKINHVFGIVTRPKSSFSRKDWNMSRMNEDNSISASVHIIQALDAHPPLVKDNQ